MTKIKQSQKTFLLKKPILAFSFTTLIFPTFFQSSSILQRHSLNSLILLPSNFVFLINFLLIIFSSSTLAQTNDQIRQKCLSPEASQNCGSCIAASPECAWCADTVKQKLTFYIFTKISLNSFQNK